MSEALRPAASELTLATVPAVLRECAGALGSGTSLILDLSGIRYADSSGLALLLELKRRARQRGAHLKVRGLPERLHELARFFSVDALLPEAA